MKAAWLLALVTAAWAAGCAGGEAANPNLAAPKLVVAARPDGDLTLFIHGAFGDRLYDQISVLVDNTTLVERTASFSVEQSLAPGFYVEARASYASEAYELRARVDHDRAEKRLLVALVDKNGEWADPQPFGLPFERLLERRGTS